MITVYENLLDNDLIEQLSNKYIKGKFRFYWSSTINTDLHHWHIPIADSDSGSENRNDLTHMMDDNPELELERRAWGQIQERCFGPSELLRYYVNGYTFGTEGGSHIDSSFEEDNTVVIYLNKKWYPIWAGETVIFNPDYTDIERSVLPKFNRAVRFPSNRLHAARSISKKCSELRLVLVCKAKPRIVDVELDRMVDILINKYKAKEIKHSNSSFLNHLVGTYKILKKQKAPDHVCRAGLFHSIYGTSIFKTATTTDRNEIREIIGDQAEELAWIFCNLDRPHCWETDARTVFMTKNHDIIRVTEQQFIELRQIEDANLQEQRPRQI